MIVENHAPLGGLGAHLLARTALIGWNGQLSRIAVDGIPVSGANDEVLSRHGLDAASIAATVRAELVVR